MIRKAEIQDLPAVAALYEAVLTEEERSGLPYTNWQRGSYPTTQTARRALEEGSLYVGQAADGTLWGTMVLNSSQLPEYGQIPWKKQAAAERVGVIHTLCIHPAFRSRKLGAELVAFGEERCRQMGKTVLRLDTWEGNLPANRFYPALGYALAGSVRLLFQGCIEEALNCYEKELTE